MIELIIVLLVLVVITAIAIPRVAISSERSLETATANMVRNVRAQIELYYAAEGVYPATLDPDWFLSGQAVNPFDPDHPTPLWLASAPNKIYPTTKKLTESSLSTMWYNNANGMFCARVPLAGSSAATLARFNRVNGTACVSMDQTE